MIKINDSNRKYERIFFLWNQSADIFKKLAKVITIRLHSTSHYVAFTWRKEDVIIG